MVEKWWRELGHKFPQVETDEYIVMPNHFHGIVVIVGADLCVCPQAKPGAHIGAPLRNPTLGEIVRWFKTMSTTEYIRNVKQNGWASCPGKLWQRNYYEHVIRNESSLNDIRSYIQTNPARWAEDDDNPANLDKSDEP